MARKSRATNPADESFRIRKVKELMGTLEMDEGYLREMESAYILGALHAFRWETNRVKRVAVK